MTWNGQNEMIPESTESVTEKFSVGDEIFHAEKGWATVFDIDDSSAAGKVLLYPESDFEDGIEEADRSRKSATVNLRLCTKSKEDERAPKYDERVRLEVDDLVYEATEPFTLSGEESGE